MFCQTCDEWTWGDHLEAHDLQGIEYQPSGKAAKYKNICYIDVTDVEVEASPSVPNVGFLRKSC